MPFSPNLGDTDMMDSLIALNVHCAFSEMAVVTAQGKMVRRDWLDSSGDIRSLFAVSCISW